MAAFLLGLCSRKVSRLKSPFRLFGSNQLVSLHSSTTRIADDKETSPSRPLPPPIRVGLTESVGRAVFATRRIGAGDLIHTAKPVVAHPTLSSLHSVCYICLKKINGSSGSGEPTVLICSNECRDNAKGFCDVETRADWSALAEYCRTHGLKYPLLAKRLACMIISGAASADSLDVLQPATLTSEMISKIEEGFGLLWNAFRKANFTDEDVAFLTKQWYINVLARIRINAFRVELVGGSYEDLLSMAAASVEAEAAVGNAVYMLPSFYNHDCDPNAHIIWIDNADARLKALRDVEEGEELRICYIDASMSYEARQTVLSQGFGFLCNCQRCQSGD